MQPKPNDYKIIAIEPNSEETPVLQKQVADGFKPLLMSAENGKVYILVGRNNQGRAGE